MDGGVDSSESAAQLLPQWVKGYARFTVIAVVLLGLTSILVACLTGLYLLILGALAALAGFDYAYHVHDGVDWQATGDMISALFSVPTAIVAAVLGIIGWVDIDVRGVAKVIQNMVTRERHYEDL